VIHLAPAEVHGRNRARTGRIVPPDIVDRHLALLRGLGESAATIAARLRAEGFVTVHVLSSAGEIDGATVRRVAQAAGRAREPGGLSRP
jgi:hypothetical protein